MTKNYSDDVINDWFYCILIDSSYEESIKYNVNPILKIYILKYK